MKTYSSKARSSAVFAALCFAAFLCLTGCTPDSAASLTPAPVTASPLPGPVPTAAAETAGPAPEPSLAPAPETDPALSPTPDLAAEMTGRVRLVRVVKSQLGSGGQIIEDGKTSESFYSQWYVGGEYPEGWNEKTPWCGIFVSWAVVQTAKLTDCVGSFVPFASMEDGIASFRDGENGAWLAPGETPLTGDLVFFDRDLDGEPDHVGVVERLKDGLLSTVEGNADGEVREAHYIPDDPRILGYGVLNWK